MASKTVSDVFLKLKVEGKETLEKLKSSFRGLEKTIGVSDAGLKQLREETIRYTQSGDKSIQTIRGQLEAFRGLRDQATIGSKAYIRLTSDIGRLTAELKKLDAGLKETEKQATRSFAQVLSTIPSRAPNKFARDIGILTAELNKQSVTAEKYGKILTDITQRTNAFAAAQARQAVIAAARPIQDPRTQFNVKTPLPNTTAALRLQIAELTTALDNADRKSTDYYMIQNRLNILQQELSGNVNEQADAYDRLASAQEASLRRAKKIADIQEYYRTQGPITPSAGGFRDPATGAMIARGTIAGRQSVPVERPMRDISGLYQQIGDIGMQNVRADIELMGNSYQKVAGDIKAATAASNGSIRSLQSQLGAWTSLRANLDPTSKAYRQVGQEIERVEKRLNRLTNKQKLSTRIRGNLGAAAAGAVFGGPEAAVGGLVGGIGGAAIGAQASMLRQSLAGTADYAAEIGKLEIALEGVAGTAGQFNDALASINDVVRDFNVPQEVATKGMTRLTAAIKGAGGNVNDADLVFKNITASIKATGGGADDVNSAITAMVQVFSKGKVSAEELSGQLGERLPGAVTLFAEANNMSMMELQKNLKAGTVGLGELMEFIKSLGDEYMKTAKRISDSPLDAGARAAVAMNEVRRAVGESIQPIGAELQAAFAEFVMEILPALTKGARIAADAFNLLLKVAGEVIKNFKELMIVAGVAGVAFALGNLIKIATTLGTAVGALQVKFAALNLTMLANPVVALVAGIAAASVALYRAATANDKFRESLEKGKITLEEGKQKVEETRLKIDKLQERLNKQSNNRLINSLKRQIAEAKDELDKFNRSMEISIYREYGDTNFIGPVLPGMTAADEKRNRQLTKFGKLTGDDPDGSKKKLMTEAEANLRIKILGYKEKEQYLNAINAQYELDKLLANQETEDIQKRRVMLEEAEVKRREAIFNQMKGIGDLQMKQQQQARDLNKELQDRQYQLGLINEKEYIQLQLQRERRRLEEAYPNASQGQIDAMVDLKRQELDPTTLEGIKTQIVTLDREITKLLNPINQIVNAASAIGDAFTQSFMSVIDGSATTQEALAGFFRNVGQYFLDMAAQIITKMITMAILNQVVGLLPGGAPMSSKGYFDPMTGKGVAGPNFGLAKGGVINKGSVQRYAMGGIVDKPTLFAYANGGTGRFGLMGEAGPEAIMPLKRGSDGKLGVAGGGGVNVGEVNITVENTGEQLSPAAQKQIANQVQGIVMANLVNERRSGGILR